MTDNRLAYKKRSSVTGGFKGFRYEIKLNSLILLRLLLHEDIEQFYLASNYDGIGAFDDICIKAKIKTRQRPFYVFIQAKHKEIHSATLDYDLMTVLEDSLNKVKAQFGCEPQSQETFFDGVFNETDCMFILYTNARKTNLRLPTVVIQEDQKTDDSFFKIVHDLIATCSDTINIGQGKKKYIPLNPQVIYHHQVRIVIYKNQSNEKEAEDEIIREIVQLQRLTANDLVKVDDRTLFLHYYYKVQEWWMEKDTSLFLSKTNSLYQNAINNIVEEPYMTAMQNGFYINNIKHYKYEFTKDAMDSLEYLREYITSIIVTDVATLTTMKVICWLRRNCKNTHSVVVLERMLEQPETEFSSLMSELRVTKKVLVVICNDTESNRVLHNRLDKLKDATQDKHVIVITDNKIYKTVKEYFDRSVVKSDEKLSLMDLAAESCKEILTDGEVLFQGQKVSLDVLVKTDSLIAITRGTVLHKFLQKETVVVGKSLRDQNYEEVKHLYIDRRLTRASACTDDYETEMILYGLEYHTVSKFSDMDTDVVLLTSSAGMGKSTLLSHMSCKTNEGNEKFWIVRINLLEHSSTFNSWKKHNTVINTSIMLNFVCQIALQKHKVDTHFVEIDGEIKIIDEKDNHEDSFELNMFLQFYKDSKVIFLFDGFDEIYPCYKYEVLNIIKYVKNNALKRIMWVTSRPYKEVLADLEQLLGESYVLECINCPEQESYLQKFWQEKIPIDNLSDNQRENILEGLKSSGKHMLNMGYVYECLIRFIERNPTPDYPPGFMPTCVTFTKNENIRSRYAYKFLGIPLLFNLLADQISNLIINFDISTFELHNNMFQMYKSFIEKKLTIYFESKYHVDLSMPKFKKDYENDLKNSFDMYKDMGAYAILRDTLFNAECCLEEFKDMPFTGVKKRNIEDMIEKLKGDEDTSGLISTITSDNLPIFIHLSFAEYFTAEFLCNILKSTVDANTRRLLYAAIKLYNLEMTYVWIPRKKEVDSELDCIIMELTKPTKLIGDLLKMKFSFGGKHWTMEQAIRLYASTLDDYESDIKEIVRISRPFYFFNNPEIDAVENIIQMHYPVPDTLDNNPNRNVIEACIANEMVARMKPHLKKYFPDAPSHRMSMEELTAKILYYYYTIAS